MAFIVTRMARRPRQMISSLQTAVSSRHQRGLFIQTQGTPNPNAMMFVPGVPVTPDASTVEFSSGSKAHASPLARRMFRVDGVCNVMYGPTFVSITKDEETSWEILKPQIFGLITEFYMSGEPLLTGDSAPSDTAIQPEDDEIVATIKELLDTRIRPIVQEDGGDIEYCGFFDGIVKLKMKGACSSCPSSEATLKDGIENMLQHYVPEVLSVEQEQDVSVEETELP